MPDALRTHTPCEGAPAPFTLPEEAPGIREDIERCAKCGQCRTVCPVFAETNVEMMVARGRISLAQAAIEGRAKYTRRMEDYIQSCIKCLRCAAMCPSGVQYERILQEIRFAMGRELGISPVAKAIFRYVLPHRGLFDLAIRAARMGQLLVPGRRQGPMRHLPLFFAGRRWVPALAKGSALKRLRHLSTAHNHGKGGRPKSRIVLFLGCLINYVYPEISEATVRVLQRLGAEVIVPRDQVCCGTPVLSFGDGAAARNLAGRNVRSMLASNPDYIVTACASCGKTLKSDYESLVGAEGTKLSKKMLDVSELLSLLSLPDLAPLPQKVTYHDPCHLRWGQKVIAQPRKLLGRFSTYVEMSEAERCCGGGGSFSLFHYDLATKIADRKLDAIAASGAEIVATNCPGCILHISDRLAARTSSTRVLHTIQVIEAAMQAAEKG